MRGAITLLNLIQNLQIIRKHLSTYTPSRLCHVQKTQRFVPETKQGPSLDIRAIARWKANNYNTFKISSGDQQKAIPYKEGNCLVVNYVILTISINNVCAPIF